MRTASQITPMLATHPGEIIKDEIDAIGISQIDFANQIGYKRSQLNEIIKGKRNINADLALILEKALGVDAEYWMEAQKNYDLDKARINARNQERIEAIEQWNFIIPHIASKFFKKQDVITGDPILDIPIVMSIYEVNNFDQLATVRVQPTYSRFRKSDKLEYDPINIIGWVKLVHYRAKSINVQLFYPEKRDQLISELKALFVRNRNTLNEATDTLARYGIKLVYQEKGEKTPVDGVSFWSGDNPAVGMTLRHSRLDNFAFTLFHELGHIFEHLTKNTQTEFVDLLPSAEDSSYKKILEEQEADAFARNTLINPYTWNTFFNKRKNYSDFDVANFAMQVGIHPSIVRGRICHEKQQYKIRTAIDNKIY